MIFTSISRLPKEIDPLLERLWDRSSHAGLWDTLQENDIFDVEIIFSVRGYLIFDGAELLLQKLWNHPVANHSKTNIGFKS